jgi:predicted amino acid dehydrogenase
MFLNDPEHWQRSQMSVLAVPDAGVQIGPQRLEAACEIVGLGYPACPNARHRGLRRAPMLG